MMAGTQIQLLTYIDVLSEQKKKEPAGVLYFNLIEPIINENKNLNEKEFYKQEIIKMVKEIEDLEFLEIIYKLIKYLCNYKE